MKKPLDFTGIDAATQQAMMDYINRAPNARYLTGAQWITDDPRSGFESEKDGYTIGIDVAKRIFRLRNSMPNQELTDITELNNVAYFGQDKLHDFAFTLSNLALHRNKVNFVFDGPGNRDLLLQVIGRSVNYLHLSSFLFFNDEAGQAVVEELINASNRGVQVRVMLDVYKTNGDVGENAALKNSDGRHEIDTNNGLVETLTSAGIMVIDMMPIKDRLSEQELDDLVDQGVPQSFIDEQIEVNDSISIDGNHTDHRKMVIADGIESIIMSHGIGSEYIYASNRGPRTGTDTRKPRWHDAATHIVGGASKKLNAFFAQRWMMCGGDVIDLRSPFFSPPSQAEGSDTVFFLASSPGQAPDDMMTLVAQEVFGQVVDPISENEIRSFYASKLLAYAQNEIIIQNPYVIDSNILLEWTRWLKQKNDLDSPINFTLIRPAMSVNDYVGSSTPIVRNWVKWLFTKHDDELREQGVNILEYNRAFNHLKLALVDDWMGVHGSYNLNYRSAKKDFEIIAVVHSKNYANQLRRMLNNDIDNDSSPAAEGPTLEDVAVAFTTLPVYPIIDAIANEFG